MLRKVLFLITIIFTLSACSIFNTISKDTVFEYINTNYTILEALDYTVISNELQQHKKDKVKCRELINAFFENNGLENSLGIQYIYKNDKQGYVSFNYYQGGGYGDNYLSKSIIFSIVSDLSITDIDDKLTEQSTNIYEWRSDNGSHSTYAEKIRDLWWLYSIREV